jgi:hypothetical protein
MMKPFDPRATWLLPADELAPRRTAEADEPTSVQPALTVQELERRLLSVDDDAPTAIQPVLKAPAKQ